jgi:type II secretory pathway pseudopilin PulG
MIPEELPGRIIKRMKGTSEKPSKILSPFDTPCLKGRGFTLIELIVIVVLLGFSSLLVYQVAWDDTTELALANACAQTLRAELRSLQIQARTSRLARRLVMTAGAETYTTQRNNGGAWADVTANVSAGCVISSTQFTANIVAFDTRGFAFEGDFLPTSFPSSPIGSDKQITLLAFGGSSISRTVTVKAGSGLVE